LEERVLTSRDFVELSNGVCRVRAPLTHDLALTLPKWRQLMAPIVAYLAQAFRGPMPRTPSRCRISQGILASCRGRPNVSAIAAATNASQVPAPAAVREQGVGHPATGGIAPRADPVRRVR
jgi:hypothetical protein